MKLKVVQGNNFWDASSQQIELINEGLRAGRMQVVIIDSEFTTDYQDRIMTKLGLKATFNLKVMNMSALIKKSLDKLKGETLSRLMALLLLQKIVAELQPKFVCFDKTLNSVSFAEKLYALIMQLKMCKISPQDLANLDAIKSDTLKRKLQDISLIFETYEKYKSDRFFDKFDRLVQLNSQLKTADLSDIDFHFCDYLSVNEAEFEVWRTIIERARSVSIGVMNAEDSQPNCDLIKSDVWDKLIALRESREIDFDILCVPSELPKFTQHILKNLLAVSPQILETSGDEVEFYEASNPRLEVEFVAKDILELVRYGARFSDFSINCADLSTYEPLIKNVFDKMQIPYSLDSAMPFSATELGKFVSAILDFASDEMQAKDLYRVVGSPLSGFSQAEYELFCNVANCYGITGEGFLTCVAPQNSDEDFLKFLELNSRLVNLYEFCVFCKTPARVSDFAEKLSALLSNFEVEKRLIQIQTELTFAGKAVASNISRQNFANFNELISGFMSTFGVYECIFGEFCKILRNEMSKISLGNMPISLDCVRIGQSGKSGVKSTKFMYVMCALEGSLPSAVGDVGLISDQDIEELGAQNLKIYPKTREKNALLRQKVINSFAYVTTRLRVSYPISMGIDSCAPAVIVSAISNMFSFCGLKLKPINLNYFWDIDFNSAGAENIVGKRYANVDCMLEDYIDGLNYGEMSARRRELQCSLERALSVFAPHKINNVEKWCEKRKEVPNLTTPSQVFFPDDKAGVTQIERFFECPYAHFLSYGVRLKERKIATMQPVDTGNILHAVLERFGRKLSKDGVQKMEEIPAFVYATFDQILRLPEFVHFNYNESNKAQLNALKRESVRACFAVNYQLSHSQYKIKFVEAKFGSDGFVPVPEIAIINTDKRIKISGKIDRADVCGNKLRIIDYKTSKNSADFKLLNFYLGKKIQLFYYLAVILDSLDFEPSGAYYLPVHKEYSEGEMISPYSSFCMQGVPSANPADLLCQDDQLCYEHPKSDIIGAQISTSKDNVKNGEIVLKTYCADEETFYKLLKYAKQVLEGAINDIYCGYIEPSHLEASCEFCKFGGICRKGINVVDKVRTSKFDIDNTAPFAKIEGKEK